MQWSAIVGIVTFIVLTGSVKGILAFSFCAVVSFIFARNLLDGDDQLDFTRYFASKGLGSAKERELLSIKSKPFPRGLKTCRHVLIRNILRDFVISWYGNVAIGGDFILETRSVLEDATISFYDKIVRTSVSSHTQKLCILLHKHLAATQAVKTSMGKNHEESENFVGVYRSLQEEHRSYRTNELQYLRNVIDLLLYRLVAPKTLGCDTGRFILREILAVKLLLPLVDIMSDPDFLNTSIINIFGESKDENLLTDSLEFNDLPKSEVKLSADLMEYLNPTLEFDYTSDYSRKLFMPQQDKKYKFKDAMVVEKDHSEIVELSMVANEANFQETNTASNSERQEENSGQLPAQKTWKTSESFVSKKPKLTNKQGSHSSILNGLTKVKNEIFKPHKDKEQNAYSKSKTIFNAIPVTGVMFARNLRRIHTSPIIHTLPVKTMTANLEESHQGEIVSEGISITEGSDLSTDDGQDISSNHKGRSASLGCEKAEGRECDAEQFCSPSVPQIIPCRVSTESTSSSFEEVDVYDFDAKVEGIDCPDSFNLTQECKIKQRNETCSSDEKCKLSQKNATPVTNRERTTGVSSGTDDSEVFERSDDGLLFDAGYGFSDADEEGVPHKAQLEDETVSLADLAIHDVPSPCSMISIPSTELVIDHSFEPYKSKYTVYVIKYNTQLWEFPKHDDHLETERSETEESIKRRYREFMELHHRLVSGTFASLMKVIPKPNRKFNSPFFRLDQDIIEGRKQLLENYLKCLVNKPEILNCDDFKGFLGIGDESQTDFRRYVIPLSNVPRIDKKLQKKVTKIIEGLKTAFDTGPVDGDKEEDYEDIRQVLGEDKTSQDEIRTFAICSGACKLNHSCCHSDNSFNTFIQQHHEENGPKKTTNYPSSALTKSKEATRLNPKNTCTEDGHASNDTRTRNYANELKSSKFPTKSKQSGTSTSFGNGGSGAMCSRQTQYRESTNPLTKIVLNLSCELLEKQQSWVCLKPVQQAATAMFGCFLEWWMKGLLSELVTEEQWQYYLRLLADTVWPGGELMKSTEHMKTEEEKLKTKEEAIQTLSNFFGAVLHTAIGQDAIESSVREIVESLQHSEINRQLLFEALEVILAEVFPDLTDDKELYLSSRNC